MPQVLDWLPGYSLAAFGGDVTAAFTVRYISSPSVFWPADSTPLAYLVDELDVRTRRTDLSAEAPSAERISRLQCSPSHELRHEPGTGRSRKRALWSEHPTLDLYAAPRLSLALDVSSNPARLPKPDSVLGTCCQLSVGPEAALSLITGQAITAFIQEEIHAHGALTDAQKLKIGLVRPGLSCRRVLAIEFPADNLLTSDRIDGSHI